MAGKPGRSGGPRKNSGGARPNSGPKPKLLDVAETDDPLDFLLKVMNGPKVEGKLRIQAARAAAQYVHSKKGEGGKKDERKAAAEKASKGRFAPSAPPRLAVVAGGKKAA